MRAVAMPTKPVDNLRKYLAAGRVSPVRVLLVFSSPFGSALGDTAVATNHLPFLRSCFGELSLTVMTADQEVWKALCGPQVRCMPFLSLEQVQTSFDVVVFDWVKIGAVETFLTACASIMIDMPPAGDYCRFRLPGGPWSEVTLPPMVNRPSRLHEIYRALGADVAVPHPVRQSRAATSSGVFLNPYASVGGKCLDVDLLRRLIKSLPSTALPVNCPSMPPQVPRGDEDVYHALNDIVMAGVNRGEVTLLPPMNKFDYVRSVCSASVVIGSDTSTQHIAAVAGVPSVACYPADAGYRYYFWGSPGPRTVCLRTPRASDRRAMAAVSQLVCEIARALTASQDQRRSDAALCVAEILRLCGEIARRSITVNAGRRRLAPALDRLSNALSEAWRSQVMPELTQLSSEVVSRAKQTPYSRDDVALARLEQVNAAKLVAILGT